MTFIFLYYSNFCLSFFPIIFISFLVCFCSIVQYYFIFFFFIEMYYEKRGKRGKRKRKR